MSDTPKAMTVIERDSQAVAMHPMASAMLAALEKNPDPETMRQLLALQREWESDNARRAFSVAMVALKAELPAVINKDAEVDFQSAKGRTRYKHATLAHVLDVIEPCLTRFGFSVAWLPSTTPAGVSVTCRLTHAAGHSVETTLASKTDDSGGKNAIQGIGSSITYLQRYSVLSLLGIATADMPDADEAKEEDPNHVDSKKNLALAAQITKRGKTRAQAEEFVGRPIDEWSAQDRSRIAAWSEPTSAVLESIIASFADAKTEADLAGAAAAAKSLTGQESEVARDAYKKRREELKGKK